MNFSKTKNIDGCCGFVSIYNGLVCENPMILEKYCVKSVYEFIDLLVYGTEKHKSLVEKMRYCIDDVENCLEKLLGHTIPTESGLCEKYFEHLQKTFTKNDDKMFSGRREVDLNFFVLASIYFNVCFKIKNSSNIYSESKFQIINDFLEEKNYDSCIELTITERHVEFVPNYKKGSDKEKIYTNLIENQKLSINIEDEIMSTELVNITLNCYEDMYEKMTDEEKEEEEAELREMMALVENQYA